MPNQQQDNYPGIFLSSTDNALPDWFSNDYHKYTNFQMIDGGGHGVLVSCDDLNLGRKVAIKTLKPEHENSSLDRKRLLREARVTAQLAHPNIIPVYEIGKNPQGQIYFSMKKVEGENLFKVLVRIAQGDSHTSEQYTLDRLLSIVTQIAHALTYAHTHGVIHRDVKPENIFLGLFGEVYLMDWGVAKVWGMPADELSEPQAIDIHADLAITAAGQRPGTPLYMSPEQIRGTPPIDERTDIFSLGVVLYEVLAQQEPFRGATVQETFTNILHKTPSPPSKIATHHSVPPELDAICRRALKKTPGHRFQSIRQMLEHIEQFRARSINHLP